MKYRLKKWFLLIPIAGVALFAVYSHQSTQTIPPTINGIAVDSLDYFYFMDSLKDSIHQVKTLNLYRKTVLSTAGIPVNQVDTITVSQWQQIHNNPRLIARNNNATTINYLLYDQNQLLAFSNTLTDSTKVIQQTWDIQSISKTSLQAFKQLESINLLNEAFFTENRDLPWIDESIHINLGDYSLHSALAGKALDVKFGNKANGGNVQIWSSNQSLAQKWAITRIEKDKFKIISKASKKALDVQFGGKENGTNVQIWTANQSGAQQWRIEQATSGYYYITSAKNGKALDIQYGTPKNGTNVQLWTKNGTKAQKWKFTQ